MPAKNRKIRYHTDPQYRAIINKDERERYRRNMESDPLFAKIHLTKARIYNARTAINHHEERVRFFYDRLEKDVRLLRKLVEQRNERGMGG